MKAVEVMSGPVVAIGEDAPLSQAIQMMGEHRVSGLPVVNAEGLLVGMLTEGDLLRRIETGTTGDPPGFFAGFFRPGHEAERFVRTHGRRVRDAMTAGLMVAEEDTPLEEIVEQMQRHHIKRVPVVRDGKLLGMVSRADIVRRVGAALATGSGSADDETIRKAIRSAMDGQTWTNGRSVALSVKDGVVQLDGCLFDLRERAALEVLAANVPGVKRVENRVVCIEPYTGMLTYDPASAGGAPFL